MDRVRDSLFGAMAIRRTSGVVILATLASALAYTQREDLYEQAAFASSEERMLSGWFETGAFVAAAGLVFIAIALIVGRPSNGPVITCSESTSGERH